MNSSSLPVAVILIVEDDEAARLMMSATLSCEKFQVLTAPDCASARVAFKEHKIDLILMDVLLPDGDGFSLCEEFLLATKGRNLPVAMVTGLDDLASISRGYKCGAIDFITKPVNWGTLPYRVDYLLQASRTLVELSLSESKTRALLSSIPDIIMRINRAGQVLDMQAGAYGCDFAAWVKVNSSDTYGSLPVSVAATVEQKITAALQGNGMQFLEFQWAAQEEAPRYWEARILQRDLDEVLMVVREITQSKHQDMQMRLWSRVFAGSNQAILIADANLQIVSVNKAYEEIMGFSEAEVADVNAGLVGTRLHTHSFFRNLLSVLKECGHWQGELTNQRKNGELFPCWFSISLLVDTQGEIENYIAIFSDISEDKNSRKKIDFLAHHDSLTGLPNRALLRDRLEMAIYTAKRRDEKLGVVFIDLDRFKNINDSLGHGVGDQILKEVAARLSTAVRSEDTVSRLGGDEFVVLLPKIKVDTDLAEVACNIASVLQVPYEISGISLHITPSMGIAVYPDDGSSPDELIKNSDAAMYLAKEKGRNNFQFYTPSLNEKALDRLRLESDFRQALIKGEFELYYQPQVKGVDNGLWGAEALIRWRHPERGLIPPADFIPLAEETGLIISLGEWVLVEALKQQKKWQLQGFTRLVVSVNISALQFNQVDFLSRVQFILESIGSNPNFVELELTESMLMGNMDASIKLIEEFRRLGFRTAIDDFGTGFSSLNYLRKLPVNVLKIDQSFVRDMLLEPESLAIVESVINLAHALGKETVAEGVETKEEYQLLCQRGCRILQGYYIARPMPVAEFDKWLTHYSC